MPRYKPQERHSLLLPVVLAEQIVPGSFAFALDYLVDHELDLSGMDAKFKNDEVGASAYDPRVMLKVVLLAYSQGLISSRTIERACVRNVQFIAISGDSQPSHAHIAKFVSHLGEQIKPLFAQTLTSAGSFYTTAIGQRYQLYGAQDACCQSCKLRSQCLKNPQNPRGRQVTRFEPKASEPNHPSERMRRAIDSACGRRLYSQRIGRVEPVFGNIRHNKRLARLYLRGREKVNTQWHLYCMVHNIEKLANSGWRQ